MASYNAVGLSKANTLLLAGVCEYAAENNVLLLADDKAELETIATILRDMRDDIIAYELANATTLNPAVLLRTVVNLF